MNYPQEKKEIREQIEAGYPLLYVLTEEERPVLESVQYVAEHSKRKHHVFSWNTVSGLVREDGKEVFSDRNMTDPRQVLSFIRKYEDHHAIFVLHDLPIWFKQMELVMEVKDTVQNITIPMTYEYTVKRYKDQHNHIYKHILITSPKLEVPTELNKLMSVIPFGLPGKGEIAVFLEDMIEDSSPNRHLTAEEKNRIIQASIGLTETEIVNIYTRSIVANGGKIDHKMITEAKKQIIKKDGLLDFDEPKVGLGDVGGLKNLLDWVKKRSVAYDPVKRAKYRLENPKGILLTGVQGCGKSHCAKAIAHYLEVPLLRLDIGALMNKWVGESESNVRKAIQLAESVSPCVLFIDEIDKALPDPTSASTHEVSKRLLSTLLTWLQEKKHPVFVVATANNIHHLPPELMRKGRFDEIFFVDLPTFEERKEIFSIHLHKKGYDSQALDLTRLAESTEGYSGSEIEVLIGEANFQAAVLDETLGEKHLYSELAKTSPLSTTMKDKVEKIREWAKDHHIRPSS